MAQRGSVRVLADVCGAVSMCLGMRKGVGMTDWVLFALGSAFFAGLTALLAKIGVEDVSSNLATFIRTIVILVFVVLLISLRREWGLSGRIHQRSVIFLVLSGLTTGLSWLCYYRALQVGPASLVAPIDKLSLVVAVALAVIVLGERLTAWQWIGAFLMTIGALVLGFA